MSYGKEQFEHSFDGCEDIADAMCGVATLAVGAPLALLTLVPAAILVTVTMVAEPWLIGLIVPYVMIAGLKRWRAAQPKQSD